jgi:hypothetical protein
MAARDDDGDESELRSQADHRLPAKKAGGVENWFTHLPLGTAREIEKSPSASMINQTALSSPSL